MTDDPQWIDAKLALEKLEVSLGRHAAKRTLAEHLRDGELRAMAARTWISVAPTLREAWKDPEKLFLQFDQIIEPRIFRASKQWSDDPSDWRWPYNKISLTIKIKPIKRRMLEGVKFHEQDVHRILNYTAPSRGGRPPKLEDWTSFWMAVITLAQNHELKPDTFPTQASLMKRILDDSRGLSQSSISQKVEQIYRKFVLPT